MEHARLDRAERDPQALGDLRLCQAFLLGQLQHFRLRWAQRVEGFANDEAVEDLIDVVGQRRYVSLLDAEQRPRGGALADVGRGAARDHEQVRADAASSRRRSGPLCATA